MAMFPAAAVTVVTAYYPLEKAKHSRASYNQWIQNFCEIPCSLVIYTCDETAEQIRSWRKDKPTILVSRPFTSYRMTTPAMMNLWQRNHAIDPEKAIHSPELFATWALKQEVVRETISSNPFQSKWFVWCDIGIQREQHLQDFYMRFPSQVPQVCAEGRMAFLEVSKIPDVFVQAWKRRTPCPLPVPAVSLGGGCIAGDASAWMEFGTAYESMLREMDQRGEFVGKDQIVFFRMLIDHKMSMPYRLFFGQRFTQLPHIEWMSFPVILGGKAPAVVDSRFESGNSRSSSFVAPVLQGGLGNQLFQVAVAYAYARRFDLLLRLPENVGGNRPPYYKTYLAAFQSYVAPPSQGKTWREPAFHYVPIPAGNQILFGYYQSSKYFADVSGEIRQLFEPALIVKDLVAARYPHLLTPQAKEQSIVVHIRRGDYLKGANQAFHACCTPEYYERAIQLVKQKHGGTCKLLIFSDDLPWCRAQTFWHGTDTDFIDENTDYLALYLMSQFRYYVISNSTFSWWATWLGESARVVAAPNRWFGPKGPQDWQDIYESDWIRVPVEP
jgi:hypothetical protein